MLILEILSHPSELDESWLKKKKKQNRFQTNLLFVGRFKKGKGNN